jgi:hypothetical protein
MANIKSLCSGCGKYYYAQCSRCFEALTPIRQCSDFTFEATSHFKTVAGLLRALELDRAAIESNGATIVRIFGPPIDMR